MRVKFDVLILMILFWSCSSKTMEKKEKLNLSIVPKEVVDHEYLDSSLMVQLSDIRFDEQQLKLGLDSFLLASSLSQKPFSLRTNVINDSTPVNILANFTNGIFDEIDYRKMKQLFCHYFYVPNTSMNLRIYVLELNFNNEKDCDFFFNSTGLKMMQNEEVFIEDGDPIVWQKGLTGATDFVFYDRDKIYWCNIACKYSKRQTRYIRDMILKNVSPKLIYKYHHCFCNGSCHSYEKTDSKGYHIK